jgi:hypothetical protein
MPWAVASAAIGAVGSYASAKKNKEAAEAGASQKQELDPRIQSILYGGGRKLKSGVTPTYGTRIVGYPGQGAAGVESNYITNPDSDYESDTGLLGRITSNLDTPQSPGLANFGKASDTYIGQNGLQDLNNMRASANALMGANQFAPQAKFEAVEAAKVNAPGQNNVDLTGAYNDMVYGQAGNNPYLTGAIQKGINQSTNAFGNYLTDATKATEGLLGNIRSGAIANNQFGSNRQALAEGKTMDSFNTQIGRAMSQFGQNNTDAAVSAQAGAYDADRNRALGAMSGLGAQQYGVASQNASMQQQAALANQDARLRQQQMNGQFQLQNNQQRNAAITAGIGANSGLLSQAYGLAGNNDSYNLNKAGQVAGMISPFTGLGGSMTSTQPMYSNTAANVMGGAMAGLGIYNSFKNANGNSGNAGSNYTNGYYTGGAAGDTWTSGYDLD